MIEDARTVPSCACCDQPAAAAQHSIHRDGMDIGPEVPLCDACGGGEAPQPAEIWARIKQRREEPIRGGIYRHYKGKHYFLLGMVTPASFPLKDGFRFGRATHSETGVEWLVQVSPKLPHGFSAYPARGSISVPDDPLVLYVPLYTPLHVPGKHRLVLRPAEMWNQWVEFGGPPVRRFTWEHEA